LITELHPANGDEQENCEEEAKDTLKEEAVGELSEQEKS
jgi:hypothetical protein